jgi:hypothetical protein
MRLIDCSHTGVNIDERILQVISEYNMNSKVFSITLDNASANAYAMSELTPSLVLYVSGSAIPSALLHKRCVCHIINLIVKSRLKCIKEKLEDFCKAISWLNSSNRRIASFKSFCIAQGVYPRKFSLDMDVRWNAPPSQGGGKVSSWNRLFGASAPAPAASVSTHAPSASTSALPVDSELQTYLDNDHGSQFDDSFSILSWWHDHKRTYHVLSIFAKDIMIVSVSTISSESVFSL